MRIGLRVRQSCNCITFASSVVSPLVGQGAYIFGAHRSSRGVSATSRDRPLCPVPPFAQASNAHTPAMQTCRPPCRPAKPCEPATLLILTSPPLPLSLEDGCQLAGWPASSREADSNWTHPRGCSGCTEKRAARGSSCASLVPGLPTHLSFV